MTRDPFTAAGAALPTLGLGLAAVGRPGYLTLGRNRDLPASRSVEALRDRTHALLDAAHARGVRYVDVARSYGRAEEFLAAWLRRRPDASDVVVGSKWGYTYTARWRTDAAVHEVKDHSPTAYDRQYAESRALLGRRLTLYQVHSVTPHSPALTDPALRDRLARAAADGVAVGLTTSGPRQADVIRAALEVTVDGRRLFSTVQATYNLLEPSAGDALAEAHEAGLTVLVKEALANGRLVAGDAPAALDEALGEIATATGVGRDAVALAAVLHQPWAAVVLSGAATVQQLHDNLAASAVPWDAGYLAGLSAAAEAPDAYWAHRARLPWH